MAGVRKSRVSDDEVAGRKVAKNLDGFLTMWSWEGRARRKQAEQRNDGEAIAVVEGCGAERMFDGKIDGCSW